MSTVKRDYYEVLSVTKNADGSEIKTAYRRLAMQFTRIAIRAKERPRHKFKEASEAFEILSDQQKRQLYDAHGHAAFQNGAGGNGFGQGVDLGDLSAI